MPKLDLDAIERTNRTSYPEPYAAAMAGRHFRRLAPASGLSDFGVSHVTLEPGGISSQRDWHEGEDEFVAILFGEAILVEEGTETTMRAGDCAAFPKGISNGHHLVNRSITDCIFIAVGREAKTDCHYPDVDIHLNAATGRFTHEDGTPYQVSAYEPNQRLSSNAAVIARSGATKQSSGAGGRTGLLRFARNDGGSVQWDV